ncbi:MAG: type II secretion system minor pseudopilin GspH [Cocleimonas sp.]|nr:type II secretion system minor pseudopilin GspH [Cocleimonas sp.]
MRVIQPYPTKQSGFTLLEVMVVVVIVAILSSAVVPLMSKNADDVLTEQADRFMALMSLVQDEAILQSRQLGLKVDEQGYSFLQQEDEGSWVPFDDGPFRARKLSSGIKASLYLEDVDIVLEEGGEGEERTTPQVFILSSGEMTPFYYELTFATGSRVRVTMDAIGNSKQEKQEGK